MVEYLYSRDTRKFDIAENELDNTLARGVACSNRGVSGVKQREDGGKGEDMEWEWASSGEDVQVFANGHMEVCSHERVAVNKYGPEPPRLKPRQSLSIQSHGRMSPEPARRQERAKRRGRGEAFGGPAGRITGEQTLECDSSASTTSIEMPAADVGI